MIFFSHHPHLVLSVLRGSDLSSELQICQDDLHSLHYRLDHLLQLRPALRLWSAQGFLPQDLRLVQRQHASGIRSDFLGTGRFLYSPMYLRSQDCFGRPISSAPDSWLDVVERVSNDNNKTLK